MIENNSDKLILSYFGQSDIGVIRTENQDSFGKFPEDDLDLYSGNGQLFIVADGVGGHTGGKEASSMAVNVIKEIYFKSIISGNKFLKEAIEEANYRIYKKASTSTEFMRMATTCCTLFLKEDTGTIGHVGDSRVYKIENNKIEQLTTDHTQVNEMLKEGILTDEEAKNYPSKSVLARAVGVAEKVKVDLLENIPLKKGQSFVLCSDGLAKVTEDEILKIVTDLSPEKSCNKLIFLANERGGKDNVTVLVIKINSGKIIIPKQEISKREIDPTKKSKLPLMLFAFSFLILIALGLVIFKNSIPFLNPNGKEENKNVIDPIKPDEQKEINEAGSNIALMEKANKFYQVGKMESALVAYQKILGKEPMHLAALNGINNIADYYFQKAEKQRSDNNFKEAIMLYSKVKELQPENKKIDQFITLCNNQIVKNESDSGSIKVTNNNNSNPPEINKKDIMVTNFETKDWDFKNIGANQFSIAADGIQFENSAQEKKSIYYLDIYNASVSIYVKLFYFKDNSRLGIIVGYEVLPGGGESYYLFNFQNENDFVLQKINGNSAEQLLFIYANDKKNNSDDYKLKIQCNENVIGIYKDGRLLSTYKNAKRVTGKIGFFVDKNVSAKFSNLSISGIKAIN